MALDWSADVWALRYGIGRGMEYGGEISWLIKSGVDQKSEPYRYFFSLHWSLGQIGGLGFDEAHAQTIEERIFATFVTFISFAVGSYVIGVLTSTMTRLNILAGDSASQIVTLRRYLQENHISTTLSARVQRNALHRLKEQEAMTAEWSVRLLEFVSEPLKEAMHFELHAGLLSEHNFFKRFCSLHPEVMRKVCHSAVTQKSMSSGDVIFSKGELPAHPAMFFVKEGTLEYARGNGIATEHVERNGFACEATLWTVWMHRGTLTAITECRLAVRNERRLAC